MTDKDLEVYYINTKHYICGVVTKKEVIVETPPILTWTKGKKIREICDYLKRKEILISFERVNAERI